MKTLKNIGLTILFISAIFSNSYAMEIATLSKKLSSENLADLNKNFLSAARCNEPEQLRIFLNKGANINAKDEEDQTALHLAVLAENNENNHESSHECILILLNSNPDLIIKTDVCGMTPLHTAAFYKKVNSVAFLLWYSSIPTRNVLLNLEDEDGQTPIQAAEAYLLLEDSEEDAENNDNQTKITQMLNNPELATEHVLSTLKPAIFKYLQKIARGENAQNPLIFK